MESDGLKWTQDQAEQENNLFNFSSSTIVRLVELVVPAGLQTRWALREEFAFRFDSETSLLSMNRFTTHF
jgi:hypothetical protein